tara:strand:- start:3599 stop:4027 length:429 start_codon:yes stop_codon:yes gene_type:complete
MTATKILGIVLGAGAVYWIINKTRFSNSLVYLPTSFKVGGSILNPEFTMGVKIVNPSNVTTTFSNLNSELFLQNGQKVANVFYREKINIPANSDVSIVLSANSNLFDLANSIYQLIISKSAKFVVRGIASVDNIPLPFIINY